MLNRHPEGAMSTIAIVRAVSPEISKCEITHLVRQPVDVQVATNQHAEYERVLASCGCRILRAPATPELADGVFVEDTALVLDEVAVMMRPGARSRRPEIASIEELLSEYRPLRRIEAPGTLDGGDILRIGRRVFVGRTSRSNRSGIAQLIAAVEPFGYAVEEVPVDGCLHLKSAVTALDDDSVIANPDWVDVRRFDVGRRIEVHPAEPSAANVIALGGRIIHGAEHAHTRRRIEKLGFEVVPVPISELAKAEAAVTCCSLIFEAEPPRHSD